MGKKSDSAPAKRSCVVVVYVTPSPTAGMQKRLTKAIERAIGVFEKWQKTPDRKSNDRTARKSE